MKITVQMPPGLVKVVGGFRGRLDSRFQKATAQARRLLVEDLSAYPAERPNQQYRRTYALRRGWQRATPIVGSRFELINPVEYAQDVQGDNQESFFKGRWTPATQIARNRESEIQKLYDQAVESTITP